MTVARLLVALVLAAGAVGVGAAELATETTLPSAAAAEHGKAATGDASPVDPGVLESEFAFAPLWSGGVLDAGEASASTQAWSLTLTYGIMADVDVKLTAAFAAAYDGTHLDARTTPRRGSGLGDLVAGTRWRFVNVPERALEIAVVAGAVIPIGSHGSPSDLAISQGFWSGRLALVATKDVGRWTTNAEVACAAPVAGDAHGMDAIGQVNVAAGYHVRRWLQPELEVNYQASLGPGPRVLALTAGVVVPWGAGDRVVVAVQQSVAAWNAPQTTGGVLAYKRAL